MSFWLTLQHYPWELSSLQQCVRKRSHTSNPPSREGVKDNILGRCPSILGVAFHLGQSFITQRTLPLVTRQELRELEVFNCLFQSSSYFLAQIQMVAISQGECAKDTSRLLDLKPFCILVPCLTPFVIRVKDKLPAQLWHMHLGIAQVRITWKGCPGYQKWPSEHTAWESAVSLCLIPPHLGSQMGWKGGFSWSPIILSCRILRL